MSQLLRIEAKHFTAGIVVRQGRVVEAAPIVRWTLGRDVRDVVYYFRKRGDKIEEVRHDELS